MEAPGPPRRWRFERDRWMWVDVAWVEGDDFPLETEGCPLPHLFGVG